MNPRKMKYFAKVYTDSQKEESKDRNTLSWLIGFYVRSAVGSCLSDKVDYPEEPIGSEQETEEISPKQSAQNFAVIAQAFNDSQKRKQGKR